VLIAKGKSTIKELEKKLRKNLSNLINIGKQLFFFFTQRYGHFEK
jgi:hypothetical protein